MDIEKEIMKLVALEFKTDDSKLRRETRFVEDLYAKSVHLIEFNALLGYKFNVPTPLNEMRNMRTIGQAIDYITQKTAVKKASRTGKEK